jgi:hypothetical protein
MIAATKARWTRGTFMFPCHQESQRQDREVLAEFPGYRWKNIILFKQQWCAGGAWTIIHAPTMLGLGARWSKLKDAKAAVEAMDAEFGLPLLDEHESWDSETRGAIRATIRRLREFA